MTVLTTERLELRRLAAADAAFILDLLNQPSFLRFIGDRGVRTLDDARAYIQNGPVDSYTRFGFGLYLTSRAADGISIGICGLLKRPALDDADLGFAFLPQFWSQGYALESAAAVLSYTRDTLGLARVAAITSPDNDASIRVLTKLGMQFERMMRLSPDSAEVKLFGIELPSPTNR